jgi:hypothetical protein
MWAGLRKGQLEPGEAGTHSDRNSVHSALCLLPLELPDYEGKNEESLGFDSWSLSPTE